MGGASLSIRNGRAQAVIQVGLTGSVAAGKSTLAELWREAGVPVVSADALAREVVAPGTRGLSAVVEAFGDGVLSPEGELDRAALRGIVFRDARERRRLEAILHPLIAERRAAWLEARRREGASLVVSELPLLFEAGLEGDVDVTVAVVASEDTSVRRLAENRGLTEKEARAMLAAQLPPAEKARRADHVLWNDGSREELAASATALLERLRERTRSEEEGPSGG